ncbi:FAD-dependent monooxygenase DEP2 [Colletotrichum liriopes]|uniref:FAD-dependent monooxygenase DEP2 n=1 Tax=Colletotrichum liriopes TaxID=708192 RepID=A0AA37GVC7_9PEZI|nr:FAD-dependent monooxygenase DEP2 [Colletotrichum liriopes]
MAEPFKVIIAGGSLGGLMLALQLERAGIDYIVLEKGEIGPQLGASIGFQPHSVKLFEQLGVWNDMKSITVPMGNRQHFDEHGKCFEDSALFTEIHKKFGRPWVFLERCAAIRILYDHIHDKSKVHAETAVVSYREEESRISIQTSKNETIFGSILVGCDGVHSGIRTLMVNQVAVLHPELAEEIVEAGGGFTCEYKCLFGVSRNSRESSLIPDGVLHTAYYDYYSSFSLVGVPGLIFWFFYVKLPSVTRMPNCPRFTDEDAHALVDQYGKTVLGPGYTLQTLWDSRIRATLAPLEEGVAKKWSHGRVVLAGDAVHKFTVNAGLGANTAYEGTTRLVNGLHDLLQEHPQPTQFQLSSMFSVYEQAQRSKAEFVLKISAAVTRYEAQDTWLLKKASRWLSPYIPDFFKAYLYAGYSSQGPILKFLADPDA